MRCSWPGAFVEFVKLVLGSCAIGRRALSAVAGRGASDVVIREGARSPDPSRVRLAGPVLFASVL